MPHHKSCAKRVKTSTAARSRNRAYKSQLHTAMRRIYNTTDQAEAEQLRSSTDSLIDRLQSKGILHKKNAANKKSKLSRFVGNLQNS
ncbi:MAG: 30S ribosomal protein S20 [Candidatus Delongbacteria bacterium]|nr:30S ribosomal protein S20 [bacterium]MBL7034066.1 30S ribosomal protein S20 [Candidatus Delongbacteria bacterium]